MRALHQQQRPSYAASGCTSSSQPSTSGRAHAAALRPLLRASAATSRCAALHHHGCCAADGDDGGLGQLAGRTGPQATHWRLHSAKTSSRQVRCRADGTNQFRQSYSSGEPGRSNQFEQQPGDGQQQQQQQQQQEGDLRALGQDLSPYVLKRLAAATGGEELPASVLGTVAALREESDRWPGWVEVQEGPRKGERVFTPGFLLRVIEPLPPEFILGTTFQRLVMLAVGALYVMAAAWAAQAVLSTHLNLGLVLVVEWARDVLGPLRLVAILALAWFGNLWLYWVWFAGARVDQVVGGVAPPVRRFCWVLFVSWVLYVCLSPIWHHPTPWLPFAPGNSAFHGMGLMRGG